MTVHMHEPGWEDRPLHERSVLADGCEACDERAKAGLAGILNMDEDHFAALWDEMLDVEFRRQNGARAYRSRNDALAGRQLYYVALLVQRNPDFTDDVPR